MKLSQRITVTTTHRRILRVQPARVRAPCPVCGREVETLAQSQAAEVLEISQQALDNLIAAGLIHAIPLVSGGCLICRDSLFGSVQYGERERGGLLISATDNEPASSLPLAVLYPS